MSYYFKASAHQRPDTVKMFNSDSWSNILLNKVSLKCSFGMPLMDSSVHFTLVVFLGKAPHIFRGENILLV